MISPTGKGIRNDSLGSGHYGAMRGGSRHKGFDFLCDPGQTVVAPIGGTILRVARPYGNSEYSGVLLAGKTLALKLFYLLPDESLIGKEVQAGDVIGIAQNISQMYGRSMRAHIHLQVVSADPQLFLI